MATYDLTTTIEGAKTITNLAVARTATFTNMEAPINGIFTFKAGEMSLTQHSMPTPIYGHKYYGRCYQKAPVGYTYGDAKFEYYAEDVDGIGLMTFGFMEPTNNEWKILSSIQTLTGTPSTKSWALRSFASNGNTDSYRKEIIIIDLTEAFGVGNEPTKEWCDKNIPFFEGTIQFMKSINLKKGDIIDIPYDGSAKGICLPAGNFRLECWGAQGGYRNSATYGGKGGYSVGDLTLTEPTVIHAYAGGFPGSGTSNAGSTTIRPGGFNGGGDRYGYYGGGGGSDFRITYDSLYSRIIVAGGGGSDGATNKTGLYGGGISGGSATQNYGSGGGGGTQTAGGTGGSSNAGTFGQGGTGKYASSGYAGAGGGGWYGGGGSYPDGSGDDDRGGGGGSGYVFTLSNASNYPSGCLLNEKYYLDSGSTIAGNASFTDYNGTTVTGHSGNGACRITVMNVLGEITNEISLGSQTLNFLRVGDNLVIKAYLGENIIFPKISK